MSDVKLTVLTEEGQVKLDFAHAVERLVLEPGLAVQVAKSMIDAAQDCGWEITLQVPPREISEQQRARLVTRIGHVLRSMEGKPHALIAVHVVDTVLAEVA